MLLLLGLAVGIALGYVYTATEVIQALLSGFVFLAWVEVLIGLLRRWLLLGERRLALNRLRAAREPPPSPRPTARRMWPSPRWTSKARWPWSR